MSDSIVTSVPEYHSKALLSSSWHRNVTWQYVVAGSDWISMINSKLDSEGSNEEEIRLAYKKEWVKKSS